MSTSSISAQIHSAAGPAATAPAASGQPWRLQPGTSGPAQGTPPRRPGSVRRTISIYLTRPDGFPNGALHLVGTGRDLLTTTGGEARVIGRASLRAVVEFDSPTRAVTQLATDPAMDGVEKLVGSSARFGFRAALQPVLDAALAQLPEAGPDTGFSLLTQLLDDIPVATLVSGAALIRHGKRERPSGSADGGRAPVDVCAGWRSGGWMALAAAGKVDRTLPPDPPAGTLVLDGDPLAWHDLPPLPVTGMRRLRRIDVAPAAAALPAGEAGSSAAAAAAFTVDAMLRDSYQERADSEVVVHEFALQAAADRAGRVVRSAARPGVVPGPDCVGAVASAGRAAGLPLTELRATVARTFVGTSTCTHLNDMLRALGGLPDLTRFLDQAG